MLLSAGMFSCQNQQQAGDQNQSCLQLFLFKCKAIKAVDEHPQYF